MLVTFEKLCERENPPVFLAFDGWEWGGHDKNFSNKG